MDDVSGGATKRTRIAQAVPNQHVGIEKGGAAYVAGKRDRGGERPPIRHCLCRGAESSVGRIVGLDGVQRLNGEVEPTATKACSSHESAPRNPCAGGPTT